ncbi:hypothetical protein GUJ93_ZPchr0006g43301 [Zizania palustris]|uniref:Uncharacterized protein n=1 Tax=Zizania palustris TaxID=103762 RepID=A0A8J5VGP0_ZIZPA|nr:hypothetical protein GUJ93_ZPchr0006g43301 [Zizania palustris]
MSSESGELLRIDPVELLFPSLVISETTLALLQHPDFCISANSVVDVKGSTNGGEKRFNQLSIEEQGKFDEETLVNVNNIKRQKAGSQRSSGFYTTSRGKKQATKFIQG